MSSFAYGKKEVKTGNIFLNRRENLSNLGDAGKIGEYC